MTENSPEHLRRAAENSLAAFREYRAAAPGLFVELAEAGHPVETVNELHELDRLTPGGTPALIEAVGQAGAEAVRDAGRSSGLRRAVRLLALLTVGSVLAGCATVQEAPDFVPPIVWESSKFAPGPTVPDPPARVVLLEDGVAELTNFPKGRTDGDEKTTCFDPQGGELYSGEARWEVRSGFLVTLAFEESEVVISSGAQFGEQDWTEIGYAPCDGSVIWEIGLVCGDSGYGQHGPSDSPQAGVFREPCTAEELE